MEGAGLHSESKTGLCGQWCHRIAPRDKTESQSVATTVLGTRTGSTRPRARAHTRSAGTDPSQTRVGVAPQAGTDVAPTRAVIRSNPTVGPRPTAAPLGQELQCPCNAKDGLGRSYRRYVQGWTSLDYTLVKGGVTESARAQLRGGY